MHQDTVWIGSHSVGDPACFRTCEELEQDWTQLEPAPRDIGHLALIVRRLEGGRRELLPSVRLEVDSGIPGDAWTRREGRNPEMSLAVIRADIARMIANGQPVELSGDNLYLALDLSKENLPHGSRVRVGGAVLEVTPKAHNGCKKFLSRFGEGAMRFASRPDLRPLNLRGIYMRTIVAGEVRVGDPVEVIHRPA